MFMFTAKLNRKKLLIALISIAVLICGLILIFSDKSEARDASSFSQIVKDNGQRVSYLESFGWEIDTEPIDSQTVLIPRKMSDTYAQYNEIQKEQGFDLSEYGGMEAVRYTYRVLNYPGKADVVADIIVFRNQVIAGDIQSVSLDGFMQGLEFPSDNQ